MKNREIEFILKLKDNLTAAWQNVWNKAATGAANLVNTWKKHWGAISVAAIAAREVINRAIDLSTSFAQFQQSQQAFASVVAKLGLDASAEFEKIRKASAGLIDDKALVESANRALSLGIPIEKIGTLMDIARAKARDMGTTTATAFNDIVTGIGRGSPMILDNLGLMLKVGEANDAYAKTLGKTANELTGTEKKMAILNATIDAGTEALTRHNLEQLTTYERMQQVRVVIENTKLLAGEILTRVGLVLVGIGQAIAYGFSAAYSVVLNTMSDVEKAMNFLGISSSKHFQQLADSALAKMQTFKNEMMSTFDAAFASAKDLAGAIGGSQPDSVDTAVTNASGSIAAMRDELKNQKAALDQLNPSTQAYIDQLVKIAETEKQIKTATETAEAAMLQQTRGAVDSVTALDLAHSKSWRKMTDVTTQSLRKQYQETELTTIKQAEAFRGLTEEMETDLENRANTMRGIMYGLTSVFQQAFTDAFRGTANAAGGFLKGILLLVIDLVQGMILAAAAAALAKGVLTFGFSTLVDIPLIVAATAGLQLVRAFVAEKFHRGGAAYVNAPRSQEIPILVTGQETVRVTTPDQERKIQRDISLIEGGGGAGQVVNLTVNINSPVPHSEWVVGSIKDALRRSGLAFDQLLVNNRQNLQLAR